MSIRPHHFEGKVVAITGAASGIGLAMARIFARVGARVFGLDIDAAALDRLEGEAKKQGQFVVGVKCDVTSLESLKESLNVVQRKFGTLDLWINNAGVQATGDFLEGDYQAFRRSIDINLCGVLNGTRIALEAMELQGYGSIANMASIAGHLPAPFLSIYNASKFGIVGFTRALKAELEIKASPVRITLISPGFVETTIINKGGAMGFPDWLGFLLSTPAATAEEIVEGLAKGREEIIPTLNGKMMQRLHRLAPSLTIKSSRVLLTKNWKDLLLGRYSRS